MDAVLPIDGSAGTPALRIRVYVGESDHHAGQPLYSAIVQAARTGGLAGATVYKGVESFGARSVVHAARVVDMSGDLPVVVEIIDEPAKIRAFVPLLSEMLGDGLMTLEETTIVYRFAGKPH